MHTGTRECARACERMRARLRAPACTLLRARHAYLRAHMCAHARSL